MEDSGQQSIFRRSEKFEIDEKPFVEIQVDNNRLIAKGKSWTTFELLISFIGAAWMEKWRRFGAKMLAGGIVLLGLPFYGIMIPGLNLLFFGPSGSYLMLPFIAVGVVLVLLWALLKREALRLYTPSKIFKVEGSAGFVSEVWKAIMTQQRLRDV